jgi:tripartite-type tricarboxylate transporter receptor subunit TctC
LKGLAVTSAKRSPAIPNVPTLAELGYPEVRNLDVNSWVGVVAPAHTPAPIISRLDAALRQTLATEEVATRLVNAGCVTVKSSPEMFAKQISADLAQWKRVIAESRLRVES